MKKTEWINCLPPKVLKEMVEQFPSRTLLSIGHNIYGEGPLLAYILFMAGAETFELTHSWLGGDRSRPEYLRIHSNSVIVKPYIENPLKKDEPLLWYLMKKTKWGFCGGCAGRGNNYMQVGTNHSPYTNEELSNELYRAIVTFQQFVKHFKR